jgi:hypothetical protein
MCLAAAPPAAADDQPTRVTVYIASADNVLSDIQYMVSDLAGQPDVWADKVAPNIEIFLIGLDRSLPVRFDALMSGPDGNRSLLMIPLTGGDAREFLRDNMRPIGVFNTPKGAPVGRPPRSVFWQLTSDPAAPVFDGWMRAAHTYGYISSVESDLPEDIAPPDASHAHLAAGGYDLAAQLLSPQEGEADRAAAFEQYRARVVDALAKYDDETAEEFEVRKLIVEQQFERLEFLFMQTDEIGAYWTLDGGQGQLDLVVDPTAGTQMESDFQASANRESFFARVPINANSVVTGRLNMNLSETLKEHFSTFYTAAIPAIEGQIDASESYTPAQAQARKAAVGTVFHMLADHAAEGTVDAFIEINAAAGGKHTMVAGMTFASTDPISDLLHQMLEFGEGWSLEENVETIGNVSVHKMTAGGGHPESLAEFFGSDAVYYVGVDGTHLWMSAGVDSLQALTTAIGQVTDESLEPPHIPMIQLDFQVRPILQLAYGWERETALDMMAFFKKGGFTNQTRERQNATNADGEEPLMAAFHDFNWQQLIIDTMAGSQARIETMFDLDAEGDMTGHVLIENDVLKAAGTVIAEFADEQL